MKKVLLFIAILFATTTSSTFAQVTKDVNGNYKSSKIAVIDTAAKATGKFYEDAAGKKYPLFVSAKGLLYCIIVSKKGNEYKKYMPKD